MRPGLLDATKGGFHVWDTRKGAKEYIQRELWFPKRYKIVPVLVWGHGVPFVGRKCPYGGLAAEFLTAAPRGVR